MTPMTDLPKLLFMCFIHLTDIEGDITPDEVLDFRALIANPKWAKSKALRVALEQLHPQYEPLWVAYDTKALTTDINAICEHWRVIGETLTADEMSSIRKAVLEFVRNVHQSSQMRAENGVLRTGGGRLQARTDLEDLFAQSALAPAPAIAITARSTTPAAAPVATHPALSGTVSGAKLIAAPKNPGVRPDGPIRIRCVNITPETHDVKTYTFVADQLIHFDYKPGQK
jgi:hypothetical protein